MLSTPLNQAIDRLDHEEVQRLLANGANPYFPGDDGRTPIQTWLESQKLGNPYAEKMGMALLAINPISAAEEAELKRVADGQVANLAQALGVLEHARQAGIPYEAAYLPPQSLESSQACWGIVYQAMDRLHGQAPVVSPREFATHFATGVATARALMDSTPGSPLVNLRHANGPVSPVPSELVLLEQTLEKSVNHGPMTVSPRGEISSQFENRGMGYLSLNGHLISANKHQAAVFHVEFEDNKPGQLAGKVPDSYWKTPSPEERLDQALKHKDWDKAQQLVNGGAKMTKLPLDNLALRLQSMDTHQDMQRLYDLGFNPLHPIRQFSSDAVRLPIHQAQSQEQFDSILHEMKRRDPNLPTFIPETAQGQRFWENSRHYVETRPQGALIGEWLGNKLRQTFNNLEQWRQNRNPTATPPEQDPTVGPSGPKPK